MVSKTSELRIRPHWKFITYVTRAISGRFALARGFSRTLPLFPYLPLMLFMGQLKLSVPLLDEASEITRVQNAWECQ